jgi:ADP-ribose pyrophosphatase
MVNDTPEKKILCRGKYLQMVLDRHWEYVERPGIPGAVVIVAITDEQKLLLVEQMRIPLGMHVLELPAGLAGDDDANESFAECAKRELLEETGYEAQELEWLAEGPTTPGLSNERITLYKAVGLRRAHDGGGIDHEQIVVHEVPLAQVPTWLAEQTQQGKLVDLKIWAALYFCRAVDAKETS